MSKPKVYGKVLNTYVYIKDNDGNQAEISDAEMTEIEKVVLLATIDLDPHTVTELQEALNLRAQINIIEVKKRGYKTRKLCRWNNLYEDPALFNWKQNTAESLARYN